MVKQTNQHYKIHVANVTLANNETLNIAFKTPNTALRIRMRIIVSTRIMGYYDLIEGEAWTTNTGTQGVAYNKDRNSGNTSAILGDQTGTFTAGEVAINATGLDAGGTIIDQRSLGGSINGGNLYQPEDHDEWILKQNETYVIRYTSLANSNGATIILIWNEE